MRPIPFFITVVLTTLSAQILQAQSAPVSYSQSLIDTAPACAKGRDLGESDVLLCTCKPNGFNRFIWGIGPYAGHSDICTAARHAGIISKAEGGVVVAHGRPGLKTYEAGEANGVKGRQWGRYRNSFDVVLAAAEPEDRADASAEVPVCEGFSVAAAPYDCVCPAAQGNTGSVWGAGPYTGDSDVCSAARHSGAVDDAGGVVTLTAQPGQTSYGGSTANGVTTSSWGAYGQSFMTTAAGSVAMGNTCDIMPAGVTVFDCVCPKGDGNTGSVWGAGPYTADSDICTAARHAGAVSGDGGPVTVLKIDGLKSYRGSVVNGTKTGDWGAYGSSIVFDAN